MKHIFLDKKSEYTFLALHGTGGDENDLVPLVHYLNPTFNILSPRGNVSEQGMNRFFKRYGMGNYDIENLEVETNNLNEFISLSITNYGLDQSKMVGLGFSNGANILESLLQLNGPILKKVVLLSPVFLQPDKPFKDLTGVDIYIATSDIDPYVKNKENDKFVDALKAAHANVYVNKHLGGHQINQAILEDLKKWLMK